MVARTGTLLALAAALAACTSTPAPIYSGSLSGSATYNDGGDSSGIVVSVSGPVSAAAVTDLNGTWSVASLPPGTYAISAVAPSAVEPFLETSVVVAQAAVIAPPLSFTGVGGISGNIVFSTAAASGVLVLVQGTGSVAVTDASGNYQFNGIVAGTYTLVASLSGQAGSTESGVRVVHGQTTPAAQMVLTSPPISGTTISGSVVIQGVAAQQGIPVSLQGPSSSAAITAADGTFSFSGLSDGQYTLSAQVRSTVPNLQTLSATITAGQPVSGATLTFAPVGIVRGTAALSADSSGDPGIAVTAQGTSSSAVTDALGRYQLTNVPVGTTTVQAAIIGGGSASTQVAVLWNEEVVAPDLVLTTSQTTATSEISGHALFAGATDNSGITVSLRGPISTSQETGVDGSFDFAGVPEGAYQLTAAATGTREGSVTTSVTLGATVLAGLSLQLTPVASISGLVTELDGTPVPDSLVFLNGGSESAVTAIDGTYLLSGAPVGTALAVQASNSNELSQLVQIAPLARGETAHPVPLVLAAHGSSASIAGAVCEVDGTPAASAQLSATGSGLGAIAATADGSGNFSFTAPEGVYSLSISASDGSSETFPVASLVGASGLVWGGASALPIGTVELQRASRIASAGVGAILSRAQGSLNPTISATSDALFLSGYVDAPEGTGTEQDGYESESVATAPGEGTLWLKTASGAVRLPSAGVFVPSTSCGLSTSLGRTLQPGPVLGPEHTALYSLPPFPNTPGPLEIGRADGTVVQPFGPQVDNLTTYETCLGVSCDCEEGGSCSCGCAGEGEYTNSYATPILSGGDTVVYLGWQSVAATAKEKGATDQLFAFNIQNALGDQPPVPVQITADNSPHNTPFFVSPDGKWAWYSQQNASETSGVSTPYSTTLAVVPTSGCAALGSSAVGSCSPVVVSPDEGETTYSTYQASVVSVSADGQSVLICIDPEDDAGTGLNPDGSTICSDTLVASVDGTIVRDLEEANVYQFTGNDGSQYLIYDDSDDSTGVIVEQFAAAPTRSLMLAEESSTACGWDWATDGVGVIVLATSCGGERVVVGAGVDNATKPSLVARGGKGRSGVRGLASATKGRTALPASVLDPLGNDSGLGLVAGVGLNFTSATPVAQVTDDGFYCVATVSGTQVVYSGSVDGALYLLDFTSGTPVTTQLYDHSAGDVWTCGGAQRTAAHRLLPSSNRVAWATQNGNDAPFVLNVTDLSGPTVISTLTLPANNTDCDVDQNTEGIQEALGSPVLADMSADGTTAVAVTCGLTASPDIDGSVTLLAADGSASGTQAVDIGTPTTRVLADGTVAFVVRDPTSDSAQFYTASLASGQLAVAAVPGSQGLIPSAYMAPDAASVAALMITEDASSEGRLGSLFYIAQKAQASLVASNVLVEAAAPTAGVIRPDGEEDGATSTCAQDLDGFLPGLGVERSPDQTALLFRSGVVGTPVQIYDVQGSAGLLQSLRFSDGKVQSMVGRASQATWLPDGTVLGVRQDSPAPYGFQDGLYLAAPWGQP